MRGHAHAVMFMAALCLIAGVASPALAEAEAETEAEAGYLTMSLEELLDLDVVTGTKKAVSLQDTSYVVSTISAEEIARYGGNTLIEVLDRHLLRKGQVLSTHDPPGSVWRILGQEAHFAGDLGGQFFENGSRPGLPQPRKQLGPSVASRCAEDRGCLLQRQVIDEFSRLYCGNWLQELGNGRGL